MFENYHVNLTGALVTSGSYVSDPIFVGNKNGFGIGVAPTGTFTAEVYLEGNNDRPDTESHPNWFLITDSFKTVSSEEIYYDVSDFSYSWVRIVVAITSGSITAGNVDMFLKRV